MNPTALWSYGAGAVVLGVWLAAMVRRGEWKQTRGAGTLVLFGPVFYAAPLAAFGVEHFTLTSGIASLIPPWIPWHLFWTYVVGTCFIAAALSVAAGVQARLSASLVALTFFLFVVLMDGPAWAHHMRDRFALALAMRELSFSGGALALAISLDEGNAPGGGSRLAAVARCFVAVPVLVFSVQQFMHGEYVPAIPLNRLTPPYIYGHGAWTYLTAAVYAAAGTLLLTGVTARGAALFLGWTVLVVELAVYVPMAVVERASLAGFNFAADTLMFCGALLLVAGAMPLTSSFQRAKAELRDASR